MCTKYSPIVVKIGFHVKMLFYGWLFFLWLIFLNLLFPKNLFLHFGAKPRGEFLYGTIQG